MNLPNKLAISRIILTPIMVAVFLIPQIPYNALIAAAIFVVGSLTDFLDGYIARKYNMITDFGKFIDPIADKVLVNAALALLLLGGVYVWQAIYIVAVIIIFSRELIIAAFRMDAARKGVVLAADIFGKIKTVLQMVALIILLPLASLPFDTTVLFYIGNSVLLLAVIMTVVSAVNYIVKNKSVFKTE